MKRSLQGLLCLLFMVSAGYAQTPTDAVMMNQRESCFALIYDGGWWDHYWEGDYLRTNGNVGTLTRKMVMPMIAIGLHDRLNLIISAPYIKTETKEGYLYGGFQHGAKGFQDFGISLKGLLLKKDIGKGNLSLLANIGYSTPASNYLSDYAPYSIGFGAPEWSFRGIAQYKLEMGLYAQASYAYLWRGQTQIERDYYYNNGSYYTNLMDVPNALNFNGAIGMWLLKNSLKLEANYMSSGCLSGDDIRKYNVGQPTNKVKIGQVGFSTQYFIKPVKGLGVLAYYSRIISGRNMGQFTNIGGGLTYQFKI